MEKQKRKRCQIAFDIQPEIREELKKRAAQKNISMNLYIVRILYQVLKEKP